MMHVALDGAKVVEVLRRRLFGEMGDKAGALIDTHDGAGGADQGREIA